MATQTSNLGLTKPAYSETADIADINNNMDKVDAAVHGVQNGMAILANGNVHSAVTSGQYVYVRNHGTLAEGLYTATTNISTNATLSTSNLTAVPNNGALNTLRDDVTSLNSKTWYTAHTYDSRITSDGFKVLRLGRLVFLSGGITSLTSSPVTFENNDTLVSGLPPAWIGGSDRLQFMVSAYDETLDRQTYRVKLTSAGQIQAYWDSVKVPKSGYGLYFNFCYIANE